MMKRAFLLFSLMAMAGSAVAADVASDRVIVKFRRNARPQAMSLHGATAMKTFSAGNGSERARRFTEEMQDFAVISLAPGENLDNAIRALKARGDVEYAGPSYRVTKFATPNDAFFANDQWNMKNTGQSILGVTGTTDADIDADQAWDVTTGNASIIVAVVDSGVDYTHPDLSANMWHNTNEIPGNNIDDDGNGIKDDYYGANFVVRTGTGVATGDPADDDGHGTHVAGVIGARGNNGTQFAGVNWTCQLMALKFLDSSGNGFSSDATEAITYAVAHGASVINNSWGINANNPEDPLLHAAMTAAKNAGVILVAAAGNTAGAKFYPAVWPEVIAVTATNNKDQNYVASTSTHNALGAPGVDVRSTLPSNGVGFQTGTSMASPHVAGVAALMKAMAPSMTPDQAKAALVASVDVPSGWNFNYGAGRLNAYNAVRSAGDVTAPTVSLDSPSPGAVVNGSISISATASDNAVLMKVWFIVDGVVIATDTASPFTTTWNTGLASDGNHTLTARAFDGGGNFTNSSIGIKIANADTILPSVGISSPAAGAIINGVGTVRASASDNNSVNRVQFFLDGVIQSTDTTVPYTWLFDSVTAANGAHTISAKAFDAIGNSTSTSVSVTVINSDIVPPSVTVTAPPAGGAVYGSFSMTAVATDDILISSVDFLVDGVVAANDTSDPYSATLNSLSYSAGTHTLTAIAYDGGGNSTSHSIPCTFASSPIDAGPPSVAASGVTPGARVTGMIALSASASDDIGVTRVDLLIDGALVDTDLAAPFNFTVNAISLGAGSHVAVLKAYDAAGNTSTSSVAFSVGGFAIGDFQPLFNPARGESVTIPLNLGETLHVQARLLDRFGALVADLADGDLAPGAVLTWDGRNTAHEVSASGAYLLVLDIGGTVERRKIIIRK